MRRMQRMGRSIAVCLPSKGGGVANTTLVRGELKVYDDK
jgi:hypothetical protein